MFADFSIANSQGAAVSRLPTKKTHNHTVKDLVLSGTRQTPTQTIVELQRVGSSSWTRKNTSSTQGPVRFCGNAKIRYCANSSTKICKKRCTINRELELGHFPFPSSLSLATLPSISPIPSARFMCINTDPLYCSVGL